MATDELSREFQPPVVPLATALPEGGFDEDATLLAVADENRVVVNPLSYERTGDLFDRVELMRRFAPASARLMDGIDITVLTSRGALAGSVKQTAQELHTRVYFAQGIIDRRQLAGDGLYLDDFTARADETLVINGDRVAACRLINANSRGLLSLPTFEHFRAFDTEKLNLLKQLAGVKRLVDIRPEDVVEFSGLAMENIPGHEPDPDQFKAAVFLYFNVLAQSLAAGHKLWVMNVEPWLFRRVAGMANTAHTISEQRNNMHPLGPRKPHMGKPTMPIAMSPQAVARDILAAGDDDPAHKKLGDILRASLRGTDAAKLPKDIRELLESQGVQLSYATLRERTAKAIASIDYISMSIITGVTVGRDLGMRSDPRFHGDFPTLSAIDLSTGLAYSQGLSKLFRGDTLPSKLKGAGVMVAFNTPTYVYLLNNSNGIPDRSLEYIGGFFLAGMAIEGGKRFLKSRRERELWQVLQQEPDQEHHA